MSYSFYIVDKEKYITVEDYDKAFSNMSEFNRIGKGGHFKMSLCDINWNNGYIRVSGSYSMSGKYAEGFVLNLVMCLLDLNYKPKVLSRDWEYGTDEDWIWFENK